MFSKTITNSGKFLKMPATSRLLYYDLGMNADDDGFVEWFTIVRMTGSAEQDLKVLEANEFVKVFDENVLVVMDWKENNYIAKDRYTPSKYLNVYKVSTECIQNDDKLDTQVRLGKVRKGKNNNTNTLATKSPDEVVLLLDFFKKNVNPHLPFNNITERKAAKQLIDTYGLEKTKQAITYLEAQRKSDAYLPTVTTPYELLTKWAKIKQHLESKQLKSPIGEAKGKNYG